MKKLLLAGAVLVVTYISVSLWLAPPSAPQQMIFHGGPIVTMEDAAPSAEAIIIEDGIITGIGSLADLQAQSPSASLYNLEGNTLMPGLIEPHSHPIAAAQFAATIDVSGFTHTSRAEVIQALKDNVDDTPTPWALAFGWDPVMVNDLEAPTLAELDAIAPEKPLLILTQMMHDAYANSAALAAAGITSDTPNPTAGEFVKDASGQLTGTIREVGAINVLFAAMPPAPAGANDLLLNLFMAEYARAGYTTVGVMGPVGNDADPIGLLKRRSGTGAPIQTMVYALPGQLAAESTPEGRGGTAPVVGVKFWMDGSPYAGGAASTEPYEVNALTTERLHLKPGHIGAVMIPEDEFTRNFTEFHTRGFQIATHVQGEEAVERVLDVAERVLADHPRADHRHRLEHNALIRPDQLARAHRLGFTTSFFIDHIRFYGDKLPLLFGAERTARYMPIGTALEAGHTVTIHADHPATPIGPLRSLTTLLKRSPNNGGDAIGPEQILSRTDALKAMTLNAAWQLGLEDTRGSLKVGKQADLLVLSQNLMTVPVDQIEATQVIGTWINGQPVDTRQTTRTNASLLWDVLMGMTGL
ncbi:MAG: amidohydrolase [Kordiimonadaceae bacterium]|nr:amidohydrolase [Kordiimonadaceae bacterium]MBO6569380.1 amidohydrolase [Kordiimonadaceae bacterium]MBO6964855.1 amidohydrolase [Kordiimonadaceae bacterium]